MSESTGIRGPWKLPLSIFIMVGWLGIVLWGTFRGVTYGRWPWGFIILGIVWTAMGARYATLELRKPKP